MSFRPAGPRIVAKIPTTRGSGNARSTRRRYTLQVTDNGNYVADLHLRKPLSDVSQAAKALSLVAGVVAHGLFPGGGDRPRTVVLVGRADGGVTTL